MFNTKDVACRFEILPFFQHRCCVPDVLFPHRGRHVRNIRKTESRGSSMAQSSPEAPGKPSTS